MITQFFIERFADLMSFVLSVLPSYTLPSFITGAISFWNDLATKTNEFGNFLPLNTIGICLIAIFAAYSFSYIVKITRIIISYFTAGGGNIQ
jgi:hypothetical protein